MFYIIIRCDYALISPYWNVKKNSNNFLIVAYSALISPYWNVKPYKAIQSIYPHRINLTILECKVFYSPIPHRPQLALISPYWNVKAIASSMLTSSPSINLTILECKVSLSAKRISRSTALISPYWNVKINES